MAKLLFLELDHEIDWGVASVGPAFIAAYLQRHGHSASLLRIQFDMKIAHITDKVKDLSPDIIGISLTSRQWLRAKALVPAIKNKLAIPIVAGGLHPTFSSDLVLNTPGFDYVCIGEGEQAMLELVEAIEHNKLPLEGIQNIRSKGSSMPELRPPFDPIDDLPFMARDMLDEKFGVVHISTQRGCPFPCTYCAARHINDLYEGSYNSYGRRRSAENVLSELTEIREHDQLNYVVFLDDTFTISHHWVEDFCAKYAKHFHIPFSINARAETVNQKLIKQLADAGCMHIIYGVESGSEQLRESILKRNVSNEHLIKVFEWTRNAGMLATANYMLGIPGETKENIEQTLALHDKLKPDDFGYFVFYPYPGTSLFKLCQKKGYLPDNYYELAANHRQSILTLPDLSKHDIENYYSHFTQLRIHDRTQAVNNKSAKQEIISQLQKAATLA